MEKDVQNKIIKYLKAKGCYVIKTIQTNRVGVPDIIACMPNGKFLAIEVKDVGKKNNLSPLQRDDLEQINAIGLGIVADSVEDLKGVFNEN